MTALAAGARTPVRLDLDPDRAELPGWAHAHGLEPAGRNVVMAHGEVVKQIKGAKPKAALLRDLAEFI